MAKPEDFFKHGSKTCPNVGRQSWIMEENIKLIDCLIICVRKFIWNRWKPHELMLQPNIFLFIF
jgi:hypothetical protein